MAAGARELITAEYRITGLSPVVIASPQQGVQGQGALPWPVPRLGARVGDVAAHQPRRPGRIDASCVLVYGLIPGAS